MGGFGGEGDVCTGSLERGSLLALLLLLLPMVYELEECFCASWI